MLSCPVAGMAVTGRRLPTLSFPAFPLSDQFLQ